MIRQIYTGKIYSINKINSYIYDIWIKSDIVFMFKAGQFVSLFLQDNESRPLSLASSPRASIEQNKIRLIVGPMEGGKLHTYISSLKINDTVKFRGPFGIFTFENTLLNPDINNLDHPNTNFSFIATSTGIAPLLSMIDYLKDIKYKNKVKLYFGIRNSKDIIFVSEFEKYLSKIDFNYKICLSRPEQNEIETEHIKFGYVTEEVIKDNKSDDYFYVCGSTKNVSAITDLLKQNNYPNIFIENYG